MHSDTYSSLFVTYQQATARSEKALLTLETKDNEEIVTLTVTRKAVKPAAGTEVRCTERYDWKAPAPPLYSSPPPNYSWRTPPRQEGTPARRSSPPYMLKRKSPSTYRRNSERKDEWQKSKFNLYNCVESETEARVEMTPLDSDLKQKNIVEKPVFVTKEETLDDPMTLNKREKKLEENSKNNVNIVRSDVNLVWENPHNEWPVKKGFFEMPPCSIRDKPSHLQCGGIAVKNKRGYFVIVHRPSCWNAGEEGDDTCNNWPGHNVEDEKFQSEEMFYSYLDQILHLDFSNFVKDRNGESLLFDWDKFYNKIFDDNNDQYENIMEYMLKYVL